MEHPWRKELECTHPGVEELEYTGDEGTRVYLGVKTEVYLRMEELFQRVQRDCGHQVSRQLHAAGSASQNCARYTGKQVVERGRFVYSDCLNTE